MHRLYYYNVHSLSMSGAAPLYDYGDDSSLSLLVHVRKHYSSPFIVVDCILALIVVPPVIVNTHSNLTN